jgi:hypothetical protein
MENNVIQDYISGDTRVGLDKLLRLQWKVEGSIASKFGITSLAPLGFLVGFAVAYFIFST